MSDHLRDLIVQTFEGGDGLEAAGQELGHLYTNPEILPHFLQLMDPSEPPRIRSFAAIALQYTFVHCWDMIESVHPWLETFLRILSTETDPNVRHLFIDALSPVFRSSVGDWPDLKRRYVRAFIVPRTGGY
jgi:hypothetical protein